MHSFVWTLLGIALSVAASVLLWFFLFKPALNQQSEGPLRLDENDPEFEELLSDKIFSPRLEIVSEGSDVQVSGVARQVYVGTENVYMPLLATEEPKMLDTVSNGWTLTDKSRPLPKGTQWSKFAVDWIYLDVVKDGQQHRVYYQDQGSHKSGQIVQNDNVIGQIYGVTTSTIEYPISSYTEPENKTLHLKFNWTLDNFVPTASLVIF